MKTIDDKAREIITSFFCVNNWENIELAKECAKISIYNIIDVLKYDLRLNEKDNQNGHLIEYWTDILNHINKCYKNKNDGL